MYPTTAKQRRPERLPQDSGEWATQPIKFRRLESQQPRTPSTAAPLVISTLVTFGVHAALLGVITVHWSLVVGMVLPIGLVSCGIGVTYLAQFRHVSTDDAGRLGAIWMVMIGPLLMTLSAEAFVFAMFAWLPGVGFGAVSGAVAGRLLNRGA